MHNPIIATNYIQRRIDEINDKGIDLVLKYDFDEFYDLEDKLEGKSLSPIYSPKYFDIFPDNAFWIEGKDQDGDIVHVQALRLMNTGRDGNLSELMLQLLTRAFEFEGESKNIICCPASTQISGDVVYQGDMWISKKCRGLALGDVVGQLGKALAYSQWQPDCIFAFLEGELSSKGYPFRQGYWNYQPLNEEWRLAYPWLYQEDWLVWMNRQDLAYMMEIDRRQTGKEQRPRYQNQNGSEKHSESKK